MPGVAQRFWAASTLQGRRWMMERRLEAVDENDVHKLQELLEAQGRCKPRELTSALEIALSKRSDQYAEVVSLLLGHGANPDGTNGSGTPFLHLAADAGSLKILEMLLRHKCSLQQIREDGASALHRAAWRGHVHCVQLLLDAGADVNACDALGRTPSVTAAQGNNTECVATLVNNGSDVNILDSNGLSVLAWSTHYNNMETFELSLPISEHYVINSQDPMGRAPLHVTAIEKNVVMMKCLIENGAECDLTDENGRTAINMSARLGHIESVHLLAQLGGSDVNIADDVGATPLVCLLRHSDLVMMLLNAGADPNVRLEDDVTPLWTCSVNNYLVSAKLLLQGNADPNIAKESSKLPLQIALYQGFGPLARMLFIVSVAMGIDIRWLRDYLMEDNFRERADASDDVSGVVTWIRDVIDLQATSYPLNLQSICRIFIRQWMGSRCLWQRIGNLSIPGRLKAYVRLSELNEYIDTNC